MQIQRLYAYVANECNVQWFIIKSYLFLFSFLHFPFFLLAFFYENVVAIMCI